MTPEQLAEIKARTDAATPAPWTGIWGDGLARIDWDYTATENLNFIAHARDDIPALVAALEAAWARGVEWQTYHANWIIEEENLRAKLAVATKALEKYGDHNFWSTEPDSAPSSRRRFFLRVFDGWEIAEKALAEIESMEGEKP